MSTPTNCLRCGCASVREDDKGWKSVFCVACMAGKNKVGNIWSRRERMTPPDWCPKRVQEVQP